MNIAVNTRLLLKDRLEGIGWFTHETFMRITLSHPEHSFFFLFDRPFDPSFVFSENVKPIVLHPQARHPLLYKYWFNRAVPKALKANNVDLFVSPDGYLSLATDVPSVAVMHDLNFEHRPQDLPGAARKYYLNNFPKFARRAKRIATVSEYSKKDIVQTYGIDPGIIDVVYDGANEAYCPLDDAEQLEVRKSASGGCPYFLYIGALHRRKNIIGMLSAFELFKERSRSEVKFLLIGDPLWKDKSISSFVKTMNFRNDVQFLGYKSEQEIARLLPSALALVLVSFFEGFGIPVLEAMYCDVPVITSTVTALPEVAGKAALLVNPESVEEIGQAMERIWADTTLRKRLVEKGWEQRKLFSWQQTAEKMWGCIEKSAAC